ncbi:response regulator transcription factor [Aquariibacter albus]|uniref:Response regulator n=1 Tax=Aquariibacter albus TaxID=2759899 RepID=A0A839HMT7_9BURK|nr:response regulator [Aquariibacter albus]MBB1163346.1 response regulator [Aquariibacter albus]
MAKILIVEDHADIAKLIRMTLEVEDHELHHAGHGAEGWHQACQLRPDLVLLDVMMPGELDGLQVCALIKGEPSLQHCRVILLTARGQQRDREEGRKAGADDYMVKPFSPLELIDRIDRLLAARA